MPDRAEATMLAPNWGPVPGLKLPAPKAVLYACDHFRSALSCRPTSRDALKRPRRAATYHLNLIDVPQVRPSFFSSQASVAKIGVPPNWRRTVTCQDAMQARGRSWLEAAGLVLVRQRPGSAKGFMFLWRMRRVRQTSSSGSRSLEKFRRVLLASAMLGVRGRIRRKRRWCTSSPTS